MGVFMLVCIIVMGAFALHVGLPLCGVIGCFRLAMQRKTIRLIVCNYTSNRLGFLAFSVWRWGHRHS